MAFAARNGFYSINVWAVRVNWAQIAAACFIRKSHPKLANIAWSMGFLLFLLLILFWVNRVRTVVRSIILISLLIASSSALINATRAFTLEGSAFRTRYGHKTAFRTEGVPRTNQERAFNQAALTVKTSSADIAVLHDLCPQLESECAFRTRNRPISALWAVVIHRAALARGKGPVVDLIGSSLTGLPFI